RDFHVTGVQTCALPIFQIFLDLKAVSVNNFESFCIACSNCKDEVLYFIFCCCYYSCVGIWFVVLVEIPIMLYQPAIFFIYSSSCSKECATLTSNMSFVSYCLLTMFIQMPLYAIRVIYNTHFISCVYFIRVKSFFPSNI